MTRIHYWVDPERGLYCETKQILGDGLETKVVVETEDIAHPRTGNLPRWAHELIPEGYNE